MAAGMQSGTERLLVMDDEEALRKLLEAVLTKLGYQSRRPGTEPKRLLYARTRRLAAAVSTPPAGLDRKGWHGRR
jgi:CheY-like chemotaxis protein